MAIRVRADLESKVAAVAERGPALGNANTALTAAIKEVGVQQEATNAASLLHCNQIIAAAKASKDRMIAQAKEVADEKRRQLQAQQYKIQAFEGDVEDAVMYATWVVGEGGDAAVLEAASVLEIGLDQIVAKDCPLDPVVSSLVRAVFSAADGGLAQLVADAGVVVGLNTQPQTQILSDLEPEPEPIVEPVTIVMTSEQTEIAMLRAQVQQMQQYLESDTMVA
jgi:hypothetical protein